MAKANYKFLRQFQGRGNYAFVEIETMQPSATGRVTYEPLEIKSDWDKPARSWIAAAIDGATEALEKFQFPECTPIKITEIRGTAADTSDEAVRCAASLAAWKALGGTELPSIEIVYGSRWKVNYPVNAYSIAGIR